MKKMLAYLTVILNALLSALGYYLLIYPNNFAPAGVGGISTMIQYLFHINAGYLNLLINLPLAVIVYFYVSKSHALRGMLFSLSFSFFLVILDYIDLTPFLYHTENGTSTVLAPIVAGVVLGVLMSQIVRIGGNQGGTFFLSLLIHKRRPEMNTFVINLAINATIGIFSYFVYGKQLEPVLLCLIYNSVVLMVPDMIYKHSRTAIRFEIVTDDPTAIRQVILEQFHHSATLLPGKGLYQGKETSVLICVVNKTQAAHLSAVLRSFPNTFSTMSQVKEVFGNFLHLDSHGLPEKQMVDLGDTDVV